MSKTELLSLNFSVSFQKKKEQVTISFLELLFTFWKIINFEKLCMSNVFFFIKICQILSNCYSYHKVKIMTVNNSCNTYSVQISSRVAYPNKIPLPQRVKICPNQTSPKIRNYSPVFIKVRLWQYCNQNLLYKIYCKDVLPKGINIKLFNLFFFFLINGSRKAFSP